MKQTVNNEKNNNCNVYFWKTTLAFNSDKRENITGANSLHYHSICEFYFIIDGECNFFIGDKCYVLKPGDLAFIPARLLHRTSYNPNNPCARFCVYCDISILPETIQKRLSSLEYYVGNLHKSFADTQNLFERIHFEYKNQDDYSFEIIKGYVASLMGLIFRAKSNMHTIQVKSSKPYIESTILYIKDHFFDRININDAAKFAAVSSMYLSRSFKKETGFTFSEYLALYRLKQAEIMLISQPEKSILQVAYDCGFNESGYFTTRFKKAYGITPLQFRNGKSSPMPKRSMSL